MFSLTTPASRTTRLSEQLMALNMARPHAQHATRKPLTRVITLPTTADFGVLRDTQIMRSSAQHNPWVQRNDRQRSKRSITVSSALDWC